MRYQEIRAFFIARKTILRKEDDAHGQLQTVRKPHPQAGFERLQRPSLRGGKMDPAQPSSAGSSYITVVSVFFE